MSDAGKAMSDLRGRIYGVMVRLHPAEFRKEFGRAMVLDFEDALHTYGVGGLWRDVLWSLARQWWKRILPGAPEAVSAARPSLLAGDYVIIRDKAFTPLELGRGVVGTVVLLSLCLYGLGGVQRAVVDLPVVSESSSTPTTAGEAGAEALPPSRSESGPSQSADATFVRIASASTTRPLDRPTAFFHFAEFAQTKLEPELLLFHPSGPLPSYEVATIKPLDPNAASSMVKLPPSGGLNPYSVRRYIMDAYGAKYEAEVIGGPDWLNKDTFVIHGKVPDELEAAFQKMTSQDGIDQNRSMQQSLLADRFHLKAHFETRVLPVYELVPAKGGLKITEVSAPPAHKPGDPPAPPRPGDKLAPGTTMDAFSSNGLRVLNGRAIKMALLARIISGDAGDRPIVDHTGFSGSFDVTDLTWAPLGDAGAENALDAPSLSGALEKTLGITLLPVRKPIEVLVIDHIEKPSEN